MDNVLSLKPVVSLEDVNLSPPDSCPISIFKADFNDGRFGRFISSLGTSFGIFDPKNETTPSVASTERRLKVNDTNFTSPTITSEDHDGSLFFKSYARKVHFQGLGMDLRKLNLASYILSNTDYPFCMTAQLTNTTKLASNCYESGKDCLKIMINSLSKGITST